MKRSIFYGFLFQLALIFTTSFAAKNTQETKLYLNDISCVIKREIKHVQKLLEKTINDDCIFDDSAMPPKKQLLAMQEDIENDAEAMDQKTANFVEELDAIADNIKTKIKEYYTKNDTCIKEFYNKNTGSCFTVSAIIDLSPDKKNNKCNNYVLTSTIDPTPKISTPTPNTSQSFIGKTVNGVKNVWAATKKCLSKTPALGNLETSMIIKTIAKQVSNLFRTRQLIQRTLVDSTYFDKHDIVVKIEKIDQSQQTPSLTTPFQKDIYVRQTTNRRK